MKKIFAAIKDKANWASLITLGLAFAGAVVSFFISREVISIAIGLIAAELFLLVVVHLESIQGTLKRVEDREMGGYQLKKRNKCKNTGEIIQGAKNDIFLCVSSLSRLLPCREMLMEASKTVKVRLLVMQSENENLYMESIKTVGRPPELKDLSHLEAYQRNPNIEIRTVDFPLYTFFNASDVDSPNGYMNIEFLLYGKMTYQSPFVELRPADAMWYPAYRNQIELLWEQGTPWEP